MRFFWGFSIQKLWCQTRFREKCHQMRLLQNEAHSAVFPEIFRITFFCNKGASVTLGKTPLITGRFLPGAIVQLPINSFPWNDPSSAATSPEVKDARPLIWMWPHSPKRDVPTLDVVKCFSIFSTRLSHKSQRSE